jgi:hypothetical protein
MYVIGVPWTSLKASSISKDISESVTTFNMEVSLTLADV